MDDKKNVEKSKKTVKSKTSTTNKRKTEKKKDNVTVKEKIKLQDINKEKVEENNIDKKEPKTIFNLTEVIIIMIVTTLFGLLLGALIAFVRIDDREVSCSAIRKDMVEFAGVYDDLLNEYYDDIDKDELMASAIKGMLSSLNDPYAAYIERTEAIDLDDTLNGAFIGIGAEIVSIDGNLPYITKIYNNGPAERQGLSVGDILVKVDDTDLSGLSVLEVAALIKTDKKGDEVKLIILRGENTIEFSVARDVIELDSVSSYVLTSEDKNIGVISITTFARNTYSQFREEYSTLSESGVDSLIIDVRNNSGGYLSSAKEVASMFLEKGDVVYKRGSKDEYEEFLSEIDKEIDLPLVILVNNCTASSAEMFTIALQENLSIDIVGTTTYGKGTIQKLHSLSSGRYVRYTVQTWLSPNGNSVDAKGIEPTLRVELSEEFLNNPTIEADNQLQQAIQLLTR